MKTKPNAIWPLLLLILGALYHRLYADYGFNVADEGSVALIAFKLFQGDVPQRDFVMGYGLMWYAPVVWLFKWCGPNFLLLKLYFHAVAIATALLAYFLVHRLTTRTWLAFLSAIVLILQPGAIHKSPIPFCVMLAMIFLTRPDLNVTAFRVRPLLAALGAVGVCTLIRTDMGLSALMLLIVLLGVHLVAFWNSLRQGKMRVLVVSLFGLAIAALVWTFRHDFANWITMLWAHGSGLKPAPAGGLDDPNWRPGTLLPRIPLSALLQRDRLQIAWCLLTYLPVVVLALTFLLVAVQTTMRWWRGNRVLTQPLMTFAVIYGMALTTFPQFWLFRPDLAHLGSFMPGYVILAALAIHGVLSWAVGDSASWKRRLIAASVVAILSAHLALYMWYGFHLPGTGSCLIRSGRDRLFQAANGVRVHVNAFEHDNFTRIANIINQHATPSDYVICFPFAPGINFMTNRRTCIRELYVDDSLLVSDPGWQARTIARIEKHQPPVILISDWALNGTEISRFRNWATTLVRHIEQHYTFLETIGDHRVYVRKSKQAN